MITSHMVPDKNMTSHLHIKVKQHIKIKLISQICYGMKAPSANVVTFQFSVLFSNNLFLNEQNLNSPYI